MKINHKAFTLAEVLITLLIIGIVVAMTLSVLINNYQKKVTGIKLQKAYSILTNALRMAEADYGGGAFPLRNEIHSVVAMRNNDNYNIFETYFVPHLNVASKYRGKKYDYKTSSGDVAFYIDNLSGSNSWCVNNEMCFAFMNHGSNYCYILVDLNGPNHGPNKVGRDTFYFAIHFNTNNTVIDGNVFMVSKTSTIDQIYNETCSKTVTGWDIGRGCTEIIIRNNWVIPDDSRYPW